MNLYAEIARWVQSIARPFRPVAMVGLVAGAVVVLALLPWTLHAAGAVAVLLIVAALALAGPVRLLRHRRQLLKTLGDEPTLRLELGELHGQAREAVDRLKALEQRRRDHKAGRVRASQGLMASLKDLRALRGALELNQAASRVRDLYLPVSPPALGLSGIAALLVLSFTIMAPVVLLVSAIGLLLR